MFDAFRSRPIRLSAQEVRPRAVVASFQDTLHSTMKEAESLGFKGRYQRLLAAMEKAFDLEQMTRIVAGGNWAKMHTTEQMQVVDLFRQFSVSTYARAFSSYDGEQFEVGDELAPWDRHYRRDTAGPQIRTTDKTKLPAARNGSRLEDHGCVP
jgi:ABC-type transporter MlaC component